MPLFKFECPIHGTFASLVTGKPGKNKCPKCGVWSIRKEAIPSSIPKVSASISESPVTMSDKEIDQRVQDFSEEAWQHISDRRQKREEVEANLPPHVIEEMQKRIEYREKLEEVMKSEPPEDLEAAGIHLWTREDIHEERLRVKYPDAKITKTEN